MTFEMTCANIGLCFWLLALILIGFILSDKKMSGGEKLSGICIITVILGLLGILFTAEATNTAVRDIVVSYEVPTSIVKTNDITLVSHIKDGVLVCNVSSSETSFWNSSNIMVRVINGKNMWNTVMNSRYNVVLRGE